MTDYLDELLEQQEQEEQGDVPEWRRPGGRVYAVGRPGETGTARTAANGSPPDVQEGPADREKDTATLLARQLDRLHRAVRQAQEQTVRTAGAPQAAAQPMAAGGLHAGPLSVRRAADYAAAVDAAFQRDARRYDGPLGLL